MAESQSERNRDAADPILTEYRRRLDQGEQVDREQFVAEHPEAADELRAHFAQQDGPEGGADGTVAWQAAQPAAHSQAIMPPDSGGPVTHAHSLSSTETTGHAARPEPQSGASSSRSSAGGSEALGVEHLASFLAASGLLAAEAVDELLAHASGEDEAAVAAQLLEELQNSGRLTGFQCEALRRGRAAELVLGNYVLLDRLGHGGIRSARSKLIPGACTICTATYQSGATT